MLQLVSGASAVSAAQTASAPPSLDNSMSTPSAGSVLSSSLCVVWHKWRRESAGLPREHPSDVCGKVSAAACSLRMSSRMWNEPSMLILARGLRLIGLVSCPAAACSKAFRRTSARRQYTSVLGMSTRIPELLVVCLLAMVTEEGMCSLP